MATAAIETTRPEILERAAELQRQIAEMQQKIQTLLQGAGALQVVLAELHDAASGRIDAQKLAAYMGVPLKRLAEGLQLNYKALHRNPSAAPHIPFARLFSNAATSLYATRDGPEPWSRKSHHWIASPNAGLDAWPSASC